MALKQAIDELAGLRERSTAEFSRVSQRLAAAIASEDHEARARTSAQLAELIAQNMTIADLMGRRRMLLEADAVRGHQSEEDRRLFLFAEISSGVVPNVTFSEAVADIVKREPRLALGWKAVSDLYSKRHSFALARSADMALTGRIQELIAESARLGRPTPRAAELVSLVGGFSRAYAETVYRTNLATAYTAGRFQQAADPDVSDVIGGFEYEAVGDSDTRPNHLAANGLIAATTDTIWDRFTPPCGFNCRCSLNFVDRADLRKMGLVGRDGHVERRIPSTFAKAYPDPGFGLGRPDRLLYQGMR